MVLNQIGSIQNSTGPAQFAHLVSAGVGVIIPEHIAQYGSRARHRDGIYAAKESQQSRILKVCIGYEVPHGSGLGTDLELTTGVNTPPRKGQNLSPAR